VHGSVLLSFNAVDIIEKLRCLDMVIATGSCGKFRFDAMYSSIELHMTKLKEERSGCLPPVPPIPLLPTRRHRLDGTTSPCPVFVADRVVINIA
jgi:hypothetical protein